MQTVMTSVETRMQIFANWPMSHAKRMTRDNRKSLEYRVVEAIRKLRTDTNCPAGKSWPNHAKNEQHIGSEKTYGPKNTEQLNLMMQRTANENAACLRRICNRSDQPKIERPVNNDARLILRKKPLTGQRHDRVQTESQIATVDSCFDLVSGSLEYGVASSEVFSWSTDTHKPTRACVISTTSQSHIIIKQ